MKIVIPGGSGQVGHILARHFHGRGEEVVVLGRGPGGREHRPSSGQKQHRPSSALSQHRPSSGQNQHGRQVAWDAKTLGPWTAELDGADVVINLAGRSVDCRYNAKNRREILESRVDSTRAVGQAIARAERPPRVWLQASSATLYRHRYDAGNDEATGQIDPAGPDQPSTWRFSVEVVKAWEAAAAEVALPATRIVPMRTSLVMSPDRHGVFDVLCKLTRRGLGGRAGDGRQYVSWIHDADFVRAVDWIIDHEELAGPINLASPHPLPNADFMRALRQACGVSFGPPAFEWMLEIGAFFLRTETELLLKSRRVLPGRLLDSGFAFEHPEWPAAARNLVQRQEPV